MTFMVDYDNPILHVFMDSDHQVVLVDSANESSTTMWCPIAKFNLKDFITGGFPEFGYPKMDGFFGENPVLKWMIWGYPYFRKPPTSKTGGIFFSTPGWVASEGCCTV